MMKNGKKIIFFPFFYDGRSAGESDFTEDLHGVYEALIFLF